jgi:protein-S-isoprenylcysteine O-methyltransferase Ste14
LLLIVSIVLAAHGIYLLRVVGRPKSGIESTTVLVIVGAYKCIRHPLYSSLLFLVWGVFLKAPSIAGGILAAAATAFLVTTAKIEESENIQKFGAEYAGYMKKTKMFIPILF